MFEGSLRLTDAVARNIEAYLKSRRLISLGARVEVTVTTQDGKILYPPMFDVEDVPLISEPIDIAAENYRLLRQGLLVKVRVILDYNTLLTNVVLALYVIVFGVILYGYYRRGLRLAQLRELASRQEVEGLRRAEKSSTRSLEKLRMERERLTAEFNRLHRSVEQEKNKASRNEDQMIEEIEIP